MTKVESGLGPWLEWTERYLSHAYGKTVMCPKENKERTKRVMHRAYATALILECLSVCLCVCVSVSLCRLCVRPKERESACEQEQVRDRQKERVHAREKKGDRSRRKSSQAGHGTIASRLPLFCTYMYMVRVSLLIYK